MILLGLGTNTGSHSGTSPLGLYLNSLSRASGQILVAAGGNETGRGHHFRSVFPASTSYEDVELRVGPDERGFTLELWARESELYSVGFLSPSGDETGRIRLSGDEERQIPFLLEGTTIHLNYTSSELATGSELILMRFDAPRRRNLENPRLPQRSRFRVNTICGCRCTALSRMKPSFCARIRTQPSPIRAIQQPSSPPPPTATRRAGSICIPAAVLPAPELSSPTLPPRRPAPASRLSRGNRNLICRRHDRRSRRDPALLVRLYAISPADQHLDCQGVSDPRG